MVAESGADIVLAIPPPFGIPEELSTWVFLEASRRSSESKAMAVFGVRATYLAYQLWLTLDMGVFEARWQSTRLVVERVLSLAIEFFKVLLPFSTLRTQGT